MNFIGLLFVASVCLLVGIVQGQVKQFLIHCGSNSSIDADGRRWIGDSVSDTNFTMSSPGIVASTDKINDESIYRNLYRTARIFNITSSYNFSVYSGNHCVRLHFCPFLFENFNANDSMFDAVANDLKLISKFNVAGEISAKNAMSNSNATYLMKEYFLNVSSNELVIEFSPNAGSFAFVNAIEVFQAPDNLFFESANRLGSADSKIPSGLGDQGMETMYRLNVGGADIESNQDLDMWRKWESDERFMFSVNAASTISNSSNISYTSSNDSLVAPLLVYETARITTNNEVVEKRFNMSWSFVVDPNFDYLIRLHFCELFYDSANQRIFKIYINKKTAAENYDVYARAGGMNKAYHEDYVDAVEIDALWLQLGPDSLTSSGGTDALLNGLEIFKLSRNGNLAYVSGRTDSSGRGFTSKGSKGKILGEATGISIFSVVTVSILAVIFFRVHLRRKKMTPAKSDTPIWRPLDLHAIVNSTTNVPLNNANGATASNRNGKRFTLVEIRTATRNFDEALVIGTGGFGKVYKGEMEEGNLVAVKRAHPQSQQGLAEFETEIAMLSKLRHKHLVSMIGYCDEQKEMILVYEYMANGTLRSHLYDSGLPALSWKQRVDVCIGAARGLHYLHTGAETERGIIHRDVKTTNILLDHDFVAKMSDFGLSKTGPALDDTHVSTAVKGSFGYLDPEYFRRQQLTQKSDVYSFGVVLFEVVCARPVINPTLPKDQVNLGEWGLSWQRQRSLETVVDPKIKGDCSLESLKKFGEIAEKCLADEGKNRPTMGEVLWHLEYALQLHEAYTQSHDVDSLTRSEANFACMPLLLPVTEEGEDEACSMPLRIQENAVEVDAEGHTSGSNVFSQLVWPQGSASSSEPNAYLTRSIPYGPLNLYINQESIFSLFVYMASFDSSSVDRLDDLLDWFDFSTNDVDSEEERAQDLIDFIKEKGDEFLVDLLQPPSNEDP